MNQIFAFQQVFEKSWEYAKEVYTCFVNLEKAYDRVPRDKLLAVLLEYYVRGQLLASIKLLYKQSEVCDCVNSIWKLNLLESMLLYDGTVFFLLFFLLDTSTR